MAKADPLAPRPNLDLSKAVRGKYYDRMKAGTNIVLIAPDLLDTFPDSESVNEALCGLKKIATRSARPTLRPSKAAYAARLLPLKSGRARVHDCRETRALKARPILA